MTIKINVIWLKINVHFLTLEWQSLIQTSGQIKQKWIKKKMKIKHVKGIELNNKSGINTQINEKIMPIYSFSCHTAIIAVVKNNKTTMSVFLARIHNWGKCEQVPFSKL